MKTLYKIALTAAILLISTGGLFAQEASDIEKGVELYNTGNYQAALEKLQKVTETDEKNRKAWLYIGMSFAKSKDNGKAVETFRKADRIADEADAKPDAGATKANLTKKPRASYTDSARENMTQGKVKLAIELGADGTIKEIFPFETLPNGLTRSSVVVAKKIKFEPAMKDGKPYSTIAVVSYAFTI